MNYHPAPRLLAIMALTPLVWCAHAQTAPGTAPITAVTLYPGSATIQRAARVEAGATRLVVSELTTQFALPTLRVDADAGIRIGQIVTQDAARTESANAAEAALETRIQALKDQAAELDVKTGAADIVKGYLERAGGAPDAGHTSATLDGKALSGMVAAINQAATDALARKQQAAVQRRDIDKKLQALERDLARVRSESRDSRTVVIQLVADRPGSVRLSYQLNSAGWRPAYRAELNSTASSVALERLAQVSQKTGEDWKGVKLSLSTTQPRAQLTAVAPQPWLLSYTPPRPAQESARGGYAMAAPAAAAPAPAPGRPRSANADNYQAPTFQTDSAFATEFTVPTPVTLPSDGREVALPLARETLAARQRVQVTPHLSSAGVLTAEVARPAGAWPDGNLQLYRDGNYVGATAWYPPGTDKWSLSFGRDDLLQVRLTPLKGDSATAGVFDKRNQRLMADQITLRNNRSTPIDVVAIEAGPVSVSEEIRVQTQYKPRPTIEGWDQRRGVVAWERTLAPQESATIDMSYTIEYPKEGNVGGLR